MSILIALAAVLAFQQDEDPNAADAVIAAWKVAYKDTDVKKRVASVVELGKTEHTKVFKILSSLLTTDEQPVRAEAAKILGGWKIRNREAGQALQFALKPNIKDDGVTVAILDSLGKLRDRSCINEIQSRMDSAKIPVTVAAIRNGGLLGSPALVERMIAMWERIVNMRKPKVPGLNSSSTTGSEIAAADEARRNAQEPALVTSINQITRQNFKSVEEARAWWNANQQTFKDLGPVDR